MALESSLATIGDKIEVEDPAADLDTHGRYSGKRKAPFSLGKLVPKVPRVVEYVESSSGGEDADVEETEMQAPLETHTEGFVKGLADLSSRDTALRIHPLCLALMRVAWVFQARLGSPLLRLY